MWGELGSLSSHEDINDNDYVDIDINSDSEDEMRSSFSKNLSSVSKLVAVGSPQARDTTGMTDSQKEAIEREDRILRKKWTKGGWSGSAPSGRGSNPDFFFFAILAISTYIKPNI